MHGGLFKDENVTLDDLRKIDRNKQPPEEGTEYMLTCKSLVSENTCKIPLGQFKTL